MEGKAERENTTRAAPPLFPSLLPALAARHRLLLRRARRVRRRVHHDARPLRHPALAPLLPARPLHRPPRHQPVDVRQDLREGALHVAALERAGLDEAQGLALAVGRRVVRLHAAQVPQVGLVAHEGHGDAAVRVVAQLLEPALCVFKRRGFRDVIDQERADGATVVGRRDGAVALLAGRVPDLGLDGLAVDLL